MAPPCNCSQITQYDRIMVFMGLINEPVTDCEIVLSTSTGHLTERTSDITMTGSPQFLNCENI